MEKGDYLNTKKWRMMSKAHPCSFARLLRMLIVAAVLSAGLDPLPKTASADTALPNLTVGTQPNAVAVNPVTNKIYVANYESGNVTVIDGRTNETSTVAAGTNPDAVAVNPVTNKIYVANYGSGNVTVIDGETNQTSTVEAGTHPYAVAVNPVTDKIYVANQDSDNVTVIDGGTNQASTVASVGRPTAVAVNPVTNKIYVANLGNTVTVIDGATQATNTVAAGTFPFAIAVNPVTNKIYVANRGGDSVTVIDGSTNATSTVAAEASPIAVAVNPVTNKVYVSNSEGNNVTVIDGATNAASTVAARERPWAIAVNPVTNKIYVANSSGSNVTIIDGATNETSTVAAGIYASAVAVNPVTNKVYVANSGGSNVTVIDGATNATSTVSAGDQPYTVAANPVTNKIYVANRAGGSVTVIDGATNQTSTVTAGTSPAAVAVNQVTNKIYVTNSGGSNVTVIDGTTNGTSTISAGNTPIAVAVNPVTNKIYVANSGGSNVTVIDGATNETSTVTTGSAPIAVAVNPVTNKIYVANSTSNDVTVIDGTTNGTSTVEAGLRPIALGINPVTNKIYVANKTSGTVVVIDGATNAIAMPIAAGSSPSAVAVNAVTNKIYVANENSANVTVIDGATNARAAVGTGTGTLPVAVAVNASTNKIYVANSYSNNVTVIDGATNQASTIAAGIYTGAVAVNPATNKIYVANRHSNNVLVIDGAGKTSNPLQVAIFPLTDNIVYGPNASFTFYASSSYSPYTPAVRKVYYQLDTLDGVWREAAAANGIWSGAVSSLTPGEHVMYAVAADAQDTGGGMGAVAAYAFTVLQLSDDADLSALTLSAGSLSPSFAPEKTDYTVQLPASAASVDVTAVISDSGASLTVGGAAAASGTARTVALKPGNNVVAVKVAAADGTTKTYTLTINRADVILGSLSVGSGTLDPAFDPDTLVYTVQSSDPITQIDVSAVAEDPGATLSISGVAGTGSVTQSVYLDMGTNFVPVVVTSANGLSSQTYVLTINGAVGSNDLSGLTVNTGTLSPAFATNETEYSVDVDHAVDSVEVTANAADSRAFLTINGRPAVSGAANTVDGLLEGDNTIPITVFAPNGTAKTYTLTVHREAAPTVLTDAEAVAADKASLAIGYKGTDNASGVTQDLTLPTSGANGTTIVWLSSNEAVTSAGAVTRPSNGSGDASVTLTAIIVKGAAWDTATFTVTVKRVEGSGHTPPGGGDSPGGGSGGGSPGGGVPGTSTDLSNALIIVNGKEFPQAAEVTTTEENGIAVTTVEVDARKFKSVVDQSGDKAVITIPVAGKAGNVTVVLPGETVQAMETNQNVLEVMTASGNYRLPASEVTADRWKGQFGDNVNVSDILIRVVISQSDGAKVQLIENAAEQGGFSIVVPPVAFTVTAEYNGQTVAIDKFNTFVEREIPLPDGVDPSRVTTAVIVDEDGTVRPVPTRFVVRDGKYYAVASSLTNSDYALIGRSASFPDVRGHWAETAVNDLASRMIVSGVDGTHFHPDAAITRAEFAAIVVRAFGLAGSGTSSAFTDVLSGSWYAGAVAIAQEYGIVSGFEDGTFLPERTITREEAMAMIARAMKLAGIDISVSDEEAQGALTRFSDAESVHGWARQSVAAAVMSGLVHGSGAALRPNSDITRAETAAIVQRMLEKAGLIGSGN